MNQGPCYHIAKEAFNKIHESFPQLTYEMIIDHPHVELMMKIVKQNGLVFDVNLNLQNDDELHLSASGLWMSWFPCTKSKVVDDYIKTVCSLISGEYRILEYFRENKLVKAKLQKPLNGEWETLYTRHSIIFSFPSFRNKVIKIVQNSFAP